VLTGEVFPIAYGVLPVSHDEHALCRDKVRFVGDPVAAVVARDESTAAEAIELIDVEYEPLRTIATPEESLAHPEPRIHDYGDGGNIHKAVALQFGDVDAALAGSDRVLTTFFRGQHAPADRAARGGGRGPDASSCHSRRTPNLAPASRARESARDAGRAIRVIATQRRRLRRQERPVQPRGRRRPAADIDRPVKIV
jgi:hypothetical protein